MQQYGRKVLCAQLDLRYGDFGSHLALNIEFSDDAKTCTTV
jgi:hypothetical protein